MPSHHAAVTGKDAILAYNRDFFGQVTAHIAVTPLETKLMGDWAYDRGTFTMTVTQRSREIALLRAIGATRRQVLRTLESNNVIIPIVGDFGGNKALSAVGQYLKGHGATVSAFYTREHRPMWAAPVILPFGLAFRAFRMASTWRAATSTPRL